MLQSILIGVAMAATTPVASHSPLQQSLNALHAYATPAQYQAFAKAVNSSDALHTQLNDLASTGVLSKLSIEAVTGRFAVSRNGSEWIFAPAFLQEGNPRLYDVVHPDDILPDHLVFALGHLAYHAQHAAGDKTDQDAWNTAVKKKMRAGQGGAALDMTADIKQMQTMRMREEAGAFIQGWNDVVDAATQQNQHKPLTVSQLGSLLLNLRYRGPFIKAMNSPAAKLAFAQNGHIETTASNLDAMTNALGTSPLIEIE